MRLESLSSERPLRPSFMLTISTSNRTSSSGAVRLIPLKWWIRAVQGFRVGKIILRCNRPTCTVAFSILNGVVYVEGQVQNREGILFLDPPQDPVLLPPVEQVEHGLVADAHFERGPCFKIAVMVRQRNLDTSTGPSEGPTKS